MLAPKGLADRQRFEPTVRVQLFKRPARVDTFAYSFTSLLGFAESLPVHVSRAKEKFGAQKTIINSMA
jgi:hypothetical protein